MRAGRVWDGEMKMKCARLTGKVFATRNSLALLPRFLTTRKKYQPQKTVNSSPKAFCRGVASSSGTPMPAYPSYAYAAVSWRAFVSTAESTNNSAHMLDSFIATSSSSSTTLIASTFASTSTSSTSTSCCSSGR